MENKQIQNENFEIIYNPDDQDDETCLTFVLHNETHTLGNVLRHILSGDKNIEFSGYCIPHPSEKKINLRVQTYGDYSAKNALNEAFEKLDATSDILMNTFKKALDEFQSKN